MGGDALPLTLASFACFRRRNHQEKKKVTLASTKLAQQNDLRASKIKKIPAAVRIPHIQDGLTPVLDEPIRMQIFWKNVAFAES